MGFSEPGVLDRHLDALTLARLPLPYEAAFPARRAFLRYRRAGGKRPSPLPDFHIGAGAQAHRLALLIRDPGRYRTWFPFVKLIAPRATLAARPADWRQSARKIPGVTTSATGWPPTCRILRHGRTGDDMNREVRKNFGNLVLVWMGCVAATATSAQSITAVSFGGSYARASQDAYHKPFTEETGIEVLLDDYNGGLAQIRAQVDAGSVHWDVVDLGLGDAVTGCDEGLFEFIDPSMLAPGVDGSSPQDDFYPDMLGECGVGMLFSSTVYAYNSDLIGETPPQSIDDFFDLERFPGRRGMRRLPAVNLEFALLADGVPVDDIYAVLDTEEGLDRAFRKLDTIKDQVVWWEAGAQPPQMLADGEVLMTTAFNGRIFNAQVLEDQPFVIVWDGQVLGFNQMVVLAGTPRLAEAMQFIEFASRPSSMARVGRFIAYGPVRKSAEALVTTHFETGVDMWPHMPNTPENTRRAVRSDWRWWRDNGDELNERFILWLSR